MKDLKITYKKDGKVEEREYDAVFDFTDEFERKSANMGVGYGREISDIHATFFENSLNTGHFSTIVELYKHCINIMK